jgi:hypothetical protein
MVKRNWRIFEAFLKRKACSGEREHDIANAGNLGQDARPSASQAAWCVGEESFPVAQEGAANRYIDSASDVAHILRDAGLPQKVQQSIWGSLTYFLDREGDPVKPDFGSLRLLLSFLANHKSWRAPDLGLNKSGVAEAVWQVPNLFRWSLEFLPVGEVRWTYVEKREQGEIARQTGRSRPDAVPLPERIEQNALSA